jgi:hypothetical protein
MLKVLAFFGFAALALTAVAALNGSRTPPEASPEPNATDLPSRNSPPPVPRLLVPTYPLRFSVN